MHYFFISFYNIIQYDDIPYMYIHRELPRKSPFFRPIFVTKLTCRWEDIAHFLITYSSIFVTNSTVI